MKLSALYLVRNEIECLPMSISTISNDMDEIVLVDNRSTDGSLEYMQQLASERPDQVKLIQMDSIFDEKTEWASRQESLSYVTGDWVAMLDADQLLGDGWFGWVRGPMSDPKYDAVRCRYEHLVGSYEFIHKSFYEKQKNPDLHPDVPLWQTVFWRTRPDLKVRPASDTNDYFREWHHASCDLSMAGRKFYNCGSVTLFHLGFCKKNAMEMSKYRIQRGDYTHDPEKKAAMIAELKASNNPFHFVGDGVVRVDYGKEHVPAVMRDKFGVTYRLGLYPDGRIRQRYGVKSGEVE